MDEQTAESSEEVLDVEEIMKAIRQKIMAGKEGIEVDEVQTAGGPLPAEFYEHLQQARLAYDRIQPRLQLTPVNTPILGPFLQRIRQQMHELVLFYLNQLAANQIRVNGHLLAAVEILGQELTKLEEQDGETKG